MGLFDFVKEAGKKLFGRDDDAEEAAKAAADAQAAEAARQMANDRRAQALGREIKGLGFVVENLSISVDGHVATVGGTAANQAEREKIILSVGNVYGIDKVNDELEVAETEPEAQFYTVVSGDSLSKIAKQFYGNAMKYPVIFEANQPMLSHPDKIYPGQVLRIPPVEDE